MIEQCFDFGSNRQRTCIATESAASNGRHPSLERASTPFIPPKVTLRHDLPMATPPQEQVQPSNRHHRQIVRGRYSRNPILLTSYSTGQATQRSSGDKLFCWTEFRISSRWIAKSASTRVSRFRAQVCHSGCGRLLKQPPVAPPMESTSKSRFSKVWLHYDAKYAS